MANVVSGKTEKYKKMHEEDSKVVEGRFQCLEPKGGSVKFSFRKYKEDPTATYHLEDGQTYKLPLSVAKHINNCGWEVHSHLLDSQGNPYVGVGKKEPRFNFQNLDFI